MPNPLAYRVEEIARDLRHLCRLLMEHERTGERGTVGDAVEFANEMAAKYHFRPEDEED
jgi:hypothetical protein